MAKKEEEVASSNPNFLPVESWDFGMYSCKDAEERLMANSIRKGHFIVRDSDPGTFSLSVRDNDIVEGDNVEHYIIYKMTGGNAVFIFQRSIFPTLSELIRHYQKNIDGLCCLLTEVCPKENPNTISLGMDQWEIHWEALIRMPKLLGQGHLSEVWKGVWNGNAPVAVKTLKEGTSADFLAEANVMKRVGHERLLQPYAVCSDREPIYIVTELMPNGIFLDYLKDGMGKDTKLTTHVDRGAHITMAKKSNEEECDKVPPDDSGMVKEGPEEAADENTTQICLLKNEEGVNETEEDTAAGEQEKSKEHVASLPPASNIKSCSDKFSVIEYNKYVYMLIGYVILIGTMISGASGQVVVKLKPSRYVSIATNETIAATDPVRQPQSYLIFASGGNHPRSYECTHGFVENNRNCIIVVGSKDETECKGLQIYENGTHFHLIVNGSMLIHDCTRFCIYQQAPGNFSLYFLDVCKNQDIDECASSPCVNGGTCVDGLDSYTCNCAKGYDGPDCEIDINECASNPCKNGGMCVDGLDSYTCNCTKGYNGANCEIDVNECASNPCQNGGACEDGLDSYACNCAKGYDGANCEIDNENPVISGCPSDQSVNTGSGNATALVTWTPPTATDNSGTQTLTSSHNPGDSFPIGNNTVTYTSRDAAGNTDTCTFLIAVADINECASNPCKNGGMCVDGLDSYTCYCSKGYDGANCEIALDRTNTRNRNLVNSLSVVVAVLATLCVTFAILYCRQRSKGKSIVILTEKKTTIAYKDDPWMSNGSPA